MRQTATVILCCVKAAMIFALPAMPVQKTDLNILRRNTRSTDGNIGCIHMASFPGELQYTSDGTPDVCGLYLIGQPDQVVEVAFLDFNVDCETGGLLAVFDGWELQGELFPGAYDHERDLAQRYTMYCGSQQPQKLFVSSQNVALIQFKIPQPGEGFKLIVNFKKNPQPISKMLLNRHGVACSRNGVRRFLKRYRLTGCLNRIYRKRAEEKKKVTDGHKQFINMWMRHNPETTARCLRDRLKSVFNLSVSVSCVSRIRKNIGWTVKHTGYCQLISAANCLKREQWCLSALKSKDTFENVIFVDETTIEMSSAGRLQFYRAQSTTDKLPYKAPKPKHAYKVHLWGGISYRGRTDLCVFTGIMDSVIYQQILERNFLPFVDKKFPDGFRLYQDNDSKHVSKSTKEWMAQKNIAHCVMEVPASSPDLNPIENLWSTLKDYLQRIIKPRKKDELVNGIKVFWNSLTAEQCCSYIDHIHKVIPEVAINRGGPTQY